MTRTTPARPLDVEALFPELAAYRGTTTRLHPRPGNPEASDSSVGGPMLWPADEPWPVEGGLPAFLSARPTEVVVGRAGELNVFACPIDPGHPHRWSIQ
ncbi:hypothetical protein [Streptomyces sp. NPDC002403]